MQRFFLFFMICSCMTVAAQQTTNNQIVTENGKVYKIVTAQKGEGLYRLAVNNNTTQEVIIAANPQLRENGLVEGMQIRIPLKEVDVSMLPATPKMSIQHVVLKGETVFSICREYNIKVADFFLLNPGTESGIAEGQVVKLPAEANMAGFTQHTIESGETLYSIGVRYGVKADEILGVNPSLNVENISIGTVIRIPVSQIPLQDDNYLYHRIEAGETLYALCMKYNILQDDIVRANPNVDWNVLSIKQIVAIPRIKAAENEAQKIHEVGKRETVYSICKRYNITADQLKEANPDANIENLQRGAVLVIPVEKPNTFLPATQNPLYVGVKEVFENPSNYDYVLQGKPTINVALMLPFDSQNEMWRYKESGSAREDATYHFKSRRYIEFCEGVKLALDTLVREGANVRLKILDVCSRLDAQNAIAKLEVVPDVIIGPAKPEEIIDVAQYAQQNKVPVVLPFATADSTILNNPYLFQASVVDSITSTAMIERMVTDCEGKNVILLASVSKSPKDIYRLHKAQELLAQKGIEPRLLTFDVRSSEKFLNCLEAERENVVLLTTSNEATAGSILTAMQSFVDLIPSKEKKVVKVYATSEWLTYQSLEVEIYHKLNTVCYSTFALDYSNPEVCDIMAKYRAQYFAEPVAFTPYFQKARNLSGFSEYAMWGYDVARKFVGARIQYGPRFGLKLNDYDIALAQTNFEFKHLTAWGGAVNVGIQKVIFGPEGRITVEK